MGVATAVALAGMAVRGVGMAQKQVAADYDSELSILEGEQQKEALDAENERLMSEQRDIKGSQRVTAAQGGYDIGQAQPLMIIAEQAGKMSQDRLELQRRGNISQSRAKSKSLLYKMQGREALVSGASNLARQGYSTYNTYKDR